MRAPSPRPPALFSLIGLIASLSGALAAPSRPAGGSGRVGAQDLFERRVRPLLAAHCFRCHGDAPRLGGLDLRTRAAALRGGTHGPAIIPGRAVASRLFRRLAGHELPAMPPTGRLPDAAIASVRDWIDGGAPWSSGWWAARRPRPTPVPARRDAWIRNPIDAFVLARLQSAGQHPAPAASRETLIRRATFDLTGLPPTPEEIEGFLVDHRPDAWERVVDRLLASTAYGERWARRWLDLARYAESEGFKSDETRPDAWRYRDYLIRAFNEDRPYDRFVREQIAGDETAPGDAQALVATGFNRHWADESNARNLRLRRQEILNDITDTVGSVFLGLTVGCARCHDHKYDPVSQADYYRLQAFFAAAQPRSDLPLASAAEQERHRQLMAEWEASTRDQRAELAGLEAPYRPKLERDSKSKFPPEVQEAVDTPPDRRTALQWQLALKVAPQLEVATDAVVKAMKPAERERWQELSTQLASMHPPRPKDLPTGIGIADVGREAPPTFVLAAGVYDAPGEAVQPAFPAALDPRPPRIAPPPGLASTGRRTALANWIASPDNPLTARVLVNRVWQSHFGRGIVPTESDFGNAGEPPTDPGLLDWLSVAFMQGSGGGEDGRLGVDRTGPSPPGTHRHPSTPLPWSLKSLHRLIMTSSTYRQASTPATAKPRLSALPGRIPRQRLEGEAIRDAILAVSGRLNPRMGGPSVFPELPQGVETRGGWPLTKEATERDRRSVYVFVRRNLRYPFFQAFDMPDTHEPCARRSVTTTAPQALMLLNDDVVLRYAQAFAGRLLRETARPPSEAGPATDGAGQSTGYDAAAAVGRAYRLAFGRVPQAAEQQLALEFLATQAARVRERGASAELALPEPSPAGLGREEGAALVDFCHALFNANEFVYLD
jgi:hypothetical protein